MIMAELIIEGYTYGEAKKRHEDGTCHAFCAFCYTEAEAELAKKEGG